MGIGDKLIQKQPDYGYTVPVFVHSKAYIS